MNNRMDHMTMNAVMAEDVNAPELRNPLLRRMNSHHNSFRSGKRRILLFGSKSKRSAA